MTTATAVTSRITPEDLLHLPDGVSYELVNGNLVERHMGSESSAVAATIVTAFSNFVRSRREGHVFTTDCGYRCFPDDPEKVRKPDVSFVRAGRLPGGRPPEGWILIPPDLAVEVLSPGDLAYEVDEKVAEYLAAGVKVVWIVNPKTRIIRIHRPDASPLGPI
jgi:Uma2 family endonuclease